MTSLTQRGGGICQMWCNSISLFRKMGDKGEGGVKNIKKRVTSLMDGPLPHNLLMKCIELFMNWTTLLKVKKNNAEIMLLYYYYSRQINLKILLLVFQSPKSNFFKEKIFGCKLPTPKFSREKNNGGVKKKVQYEYNKNYELT